jgi:hypothetical protein
VVPALSIVLGWEVEGVGVGGSGGVECETLGVGYCGYDFMLDLSVRVCNLSVPDVKDQAVSSRYRDMQYVSAYQAISRSDRLPRL